MLPGMANFIPERKLRRDPNGVPIIPDKVADKISQGKRNFSIEEVVGEKAVEAIAAGNAQRGAPIHAEALRPMSREEARQRTTFDGQSLPNLPTTRRVIPAPFKRPVINLQVPGAPRKEWRYIRADELAEGDIVPGVGKVVEVGSHIDRRTVAGVEGVAVNTFVFAVGQGGQVGVYEPHEQVRAFRF